MQRLIAAARANPGTALGLGAALSGTGTNMAAVLVALQVKAVTGSDLWLAVSFVCTMGLSVLFNPLAGWTADRFPRRHVMIATSILCALLWLPALAWSDLPLVLVICATLVNIVDLPYDLAGFATIPDVVDTQAIPKQYSRFATGYNVGKIAGPVLGALAFEHGSLTLALALNAATFLACAALVSLLHFPHASPATSPTETTPPTQNLLEQNGDAPQTPSETATGFTAWRTALGTGFAVVGARVLLIAIAAETFLATIAVNTSFVTNADLAQNLGSVGAYGWLTAIVGGGYLVGSFVGGYIPAERTRFWLIWASAGLSVGWVLVACAPSLWVVAVGLLIGTACDAASGVCATTLVQDSTESASRGRTFAVFETVGSLANVLGFLAAGVALEVVDAQAVYAFGAVLTAVATVGLAAAVWKERSTAQA